MFHSNEKSNSWIDSLTEHLKISNMRSRRLASFDDGIFSSPYVQPFSKFIKLATDIVTEIINYTNKIEKKILHFNSLPINEDSTEMNLKAKKEVSTSRVGHMSLEEAEDVLLKIQGTYVMYVFIHDYCNYYYYYYHYYYYYCCNYHCYYYHDDLF